ncbi:hypothetical protein [Mycobacterium sp. IDR2000157661]|uniref:hypothetical protein n=1 Tax=Mycobacterium sp. IDR2000157661 TaxID=2867005 RepID=UPI001EEC7F0A|nr:hypothetical protein [Mycobacterium sp. IDR2000157661]ULE32715.1 hypothetical protein K3G64_21925 [Mycobacterium sp. IDR2000157661]
MLTVPAFVWRGGPALRGLTLGGAVGLGVGVLAWLDSGFLLSGLIVFVVVGAFYGTWMSRHMTRFWPGADRLDPDDRVAVAGAARRGEHIGDPRLSGAVVDYSRGLHAAAEKARPVRWVLPLVLVVALATAVWDGLFGSWGTAVASAVYLVVLVIELFWWPKRRDQLLANTARSADTAGRV